MNIVQEKWKTQISKINGPSDANIIQWLKEKNLGMF